MTTLDQLGLKHGTDKASYGHDYLVRYEPFLAPMRESAMKVLEIGVAGGNSLRMWGEYFPNATIFGVDLIRDFIKQATLHPEMPISRFQMYTMDASSAPDWFQFERCWGSRFDLIIDDGAHTTFAIAQAFMCAFPLLRSGGLYICEDLHAGYLEEYRRDNARMNYRKQYTPADFFKDLIDRVNEDGHGQTGKVELCETQISFLHFSKSFVIAGKR